MADNFKFVQAQPFSLAGAGALIGDTTLTLKTFAGIDGALITMTDFGIRGFGTISPGNGSLEEQICFTGVTQNANGTATLTGVKSVLFVAPYTQAANLLKTHAGSSPFIISNTSGFYDQLDSGDNDETITGTYTFTNPNYPRMDTATPPPTDDEQLATKKYVDDTAIAGAPDASVGTKGITKLSVAPASPTNPIAVGDNDPRIPTQGENDALVGTVGTPSSTNKYVTNDDTATTSTVGEVVRANGSGKIDSSWLTGTAALKYGGTGADGALSISSGVTNIDLLGASVVVKNYTSISITGTASLTFTNPGTKGTIVVLKSQGNVTITSSTNPAIDMRLIGAAAGNYGTGFVSGTNFGQDTPVANFTATNTTKGFKNTQSIEGKLLNIYAGGAGATGAGGYGQGVGGRGGGGLYIECGGDWNVTSNIALDGENGASNGSSGFSNVDIYGGSGGSSYNDGGSGVFTSANTGAGGGGGAGGVFVGLYNGTLIANSGTYTVTAGTGGNFGGATGGTGYTLVAFNTVFV